jgi:hypothetical protein
MTKEERLQKLQTILNQIDEGISKADFTESFRNVVNQVLRVEKSLSDKNNSNIADLKALFSSLKEEVALSTDSKLKSAISQLEEKIGKAEKDLENEINFMRDKVRGLKDGKNGENGKDGQPGKKGDKGDSFSQEDLNNLWDAINELKKRPISEARMFGGGAKNIAIQGSGVVKSKYARTINFTGATVTESQGITTVAIAPGGGANVEIPTGDVNGTNTTFTVLNTPAFITLDGQTLYENNGYTLAVLTITTDIAPTSIIRSHY